VTDQSPIKNLLEITEGGKVFKQLTSLSQLESGGRYLLVCGRASNRIMLPSVVTKSNSSGARIGFDLTDSSVYVDNVIYGDFDDYLWRFTQKDGKWLLGNGKGYAKFTSTSTNKVTATFETSGDLFTIGYSGTFTFTAGANCLNYNSRGLVNGYSSDPSEFYIFKYIGYSINAKNADVLVDGKKSEASLPGKLITVKLNNIPEGKRFAGWQLLEGDVKVNDLSSEEISFVMMDGPVKLVAKYKDLILGDVNDDGVVDVLDAAAIQKYAVGKSTMTPEQLYNADVNNDGNVDVLDAAEIQKYSVGKITEFKKKA
jgi:hypothetical protein